MTDAERWAITAWDDGFRSGAEAYWAGAALPGYGQEPDGPAWLTHAPQIADCMWAAAYRIGYLTAEKRKGPMDLTDCGFVPKKS